MMIYSVMGQAKHNCWELETHRELSYLRSWRDTNRIIKKHKCIRVLHCW